MDVLYAVEQNQIFNRPMIELRLREFEDKDSVVVRQNSLGDGEGRLLKTFRVLAPSGLTVRVEKAPEEAR